MGFCPRQPVEIWWGRGGRSKTTVFVYILMTRGFCPNRTETKWTQHLHLEDPSGTASSDSIIRRSLCFGLRISTSGLINPFMIQIDDIAGGIVRHAGNAAMRIDVDWDMIRAGLLALADHPGGQTALKTAIKRINDPDVLAVLAHWFKRAAEEQQNAERKTKRPAETGLGPLQTTLMGLSGAAVIAGLAGTIALPVAAFVFTTLAVGAGTAWFGRMKLLDRADQYEDRAKALNSLAKICHDD